VSVCWIWSKASCMTDFSLSSFNLHICLNMSIFFQNQGFTLGFVLRQRFGYVGVNYPGYRESPISVQNSRIRSVPYSGIWLGNYTPVPGGDPTSTGWSDGFTKLKWTNHNDEPRRHSTTLWLSVGERDFTTCPPYPVTREGDPALCTPRVSAIQ
jgi:hypothetical protein